MKKLLLYSLILLTYVPVLSANDIDNYFQEYKTTGKSDYKTEQEIIRTNKLDKLISQLTPYYTDSLTIIRQKAYYLTYKKGISGTEKNEAAVLKLLEGCNDRNGGIVGQNLGFLKDFSPATFNKQARKNIEDLLNKRHAVHFKKLAMLAGYVGISPESLEKQLLMPDITKEKKWALSLALAREGKTEQIEYCLNVIKKMPVNNDLMNYILPDLIYIRQKEAIDYCIILLNSDEKLCSPSDPDKQGKILCGYYMMEQLATVVIDFPYKIDGTGSLITEDYESALNTVRKWFQTNPTYKLNTEIF